MCHPSESQFRSKRPKVLQIQDDLFPVFNWFFFSLGQANVVFWKVNDAIKFVKEYHGVGLDGRPMSIAFDPSRRIESSAKTMAQRLGGRFHGKSQGIRKVQGQGKVFKKKKAKNFAGSFKKKAKVWKEEKVPTAEELDREMDLHVQNRNREAKFTPIDYDDIKLAEDLDDEMDKYMSERANIANSNPGAFSFTL